MDMQNVSNLVIPEGEVRTIHDKDNRLIWGRVNYDTKYVGDTAQDGTPTPDAPISVQKVTGEQNVWVHSKNVASPNSTMVYKNNANVVITPLSTGIQISHPDNGQNKQAIFSTGINLNPYKGKVIRMKSNFDVSGAYRLVRMDSDGNNRVLENYTTTSGTVISLTVPNDLGVSEYLGFQLQLNSSSALVCNFTDLIMTIDNADMSYEPYQSQSYTVDLGSIELCKLGDYQDYIYKSGDGWYLHKEIGKITLTGSVTENWSVAQSIGSPDCLYCFSAVIDTLSITTSSSQTWAKCSHFANAGKGITSNVIDNKSEFIVGTTTSRLRLLVRKEVATDRATWETWLSTNAPSVYYALETPTDTKITDSTLISQFDAIHQFLTRYGYSATVSGNLPLIIDKTNL